MFEEFQPTPSSELIQFNDQITPMKAVVENDINSWLETNKKNVATPKFKIRKQINKPNTISLGGI